MAQNGHGVPNPFPLRAEAERENARNGLYAEAAGPPLNPMGVSMPYAPLPNPNPYSPVAPQQQRVHNGRLAVRFNGRAIPQDQFMQPTPQPVHGGSPAFPFAPQGQTNPGGSSAFPFASPGQHNPGGSPGFTFAPRGQNNPGGSPAFPFSPTGHNTYSGLQGNPYSQGPGSQFPTGGNFPFGVPPMAGTQRTQSGLPGTYGPTPASHFPSMSPLQNALPQQVPFNQPTSASSTAPPPRPQYLIIGLFALRLTQHLIMYLNPYAGSDTALRWLDAVLRSYDTRYALAKLKDRRSIEDYVRVYPGIVRSMIRQPKYRSVFMGMNPNQNVEGRELSDEELQAMIDFADAAGEWGSVVSLPSKYAQRMEQLANARSMAE